MVTLNFLMTPNFTSNYWRNSLRRLTRHHLVKILWQLLICISMFSAIGTQSMRFYSVKIPNKFDCVFELWNQFLLFFLFFFVLKIQKRIKKKKKLNKGRRFCFYIMNHARYSSYSTASDMKMDGWGITAWNLTLLSFHWIQGISMTRTISFNIYIYESYNWFSGTDTL